MKNAPGGGDGHSPDPLFVDTVPFAVVSDAVAIQYKDRLVLSVTGESEGFDGRLTIVRSNTRIYPPVFSVFAQPGNCGITGKCPPGRQTTETVVFAGVFREIQLQTASGMLRLTVRHAYDPEFLVAALDAGGGPKLVNADADEVDFGWRATLNMMPLNGEHTLVVIGTLLMPTPGYKLTLARPEPQGINPTVDLLDLTIEKPTGIVIQVPAPATVRYEEKTKAIYTSVHVKNTDVVIPVEFAW